MKRLLVILLGIMINSMQATMLAKISPKIQMIGGSALTSLSAYSFLKSNAFQEYRSNMKCLNTLENINLFIKNGQHNEALQTMLTEAGYKMAQDDIERKTKIAAHADRMVSKLAVEFGRAESESGSASPQSKIEQPALEEIAELTPQELEACKGKVARSLCIYIYNLHLRRNIGLLVPDCRSNFTFYTKINALINSEKRFEHLDFYGKTALKAALGISGILLIRNGLQSK